MNKKKMIIGIASVCVVCAIVIGTTLAFLTDSEKVVNTFTVGDFDITLTEPHWNDGVPDDPKTTDTDESVPGDGSDLTPGSTKIKDPVVTANINSGYVRVIVSVIDRNKTIADPENVGKTIDNPNFGKLVTDKERLDLIMGTLYYDDSYNASATPATSKIVPDTKYSKDYLSAFNTFNTKDFTLDTSLSVNGISDSYPGRGHSERELWFGRGSAGSVERGAYEDCLGKKLSVYVQTIYQKHS